MIREFIGIAIGLFLKLYVLAIIAGLMFFVVMVSRIVIIKLSSKKISEFVDYFFFEIFENEMFAKKPEYKYKIDYHCHYHCHETCIFMDHNKDVKEAAQFVLDFPEFDDYLKFKVMPFHFKFLNEVVQERLKTLVLEKMKIKEKRCDKIVTQTQTSKGVI